MGGRTSKAVKTLSAREVLSRRHPETNPASESTVPREPAKVNDFVPFSSLPSPPISAQYEIDPAMLTKVMKEFNIKSTPVKVL